MSKSKKFDVFAFEAPPAKGPGDRFRQSNPNKFESGTPKTFSPQFNFHGDEPSQALRKPVQGSSVSGGGDKSVGMPWPLFCHTPKSKGK